MWGWETGNNAGYGGVFVWGRVSPWMLRIFDAGFEISVLFGAGFLCTWMVFMSRGGASRCSVSGEREDLYLGRSSVCFWSPGRWGSL